MKCYEALRVCSEHGAVAVAEPGLPRDGWTCGKDRCGLPLETVEYVRADADRGAVDLDPAKTIETLARVIENRHGTLIGIGDTLREAFAELKRGQVAR